MSDNKNKGQSVPEYSAEDYKKALTDLDEVRDDDFFGTKTFTETGSSVMAVIKALVYIVFIVAVSCALAYFALAWVNDAFAFVKEDKEYSITIPEYASADEIAEILGDAGVVNHPKIMKVYSKLKKVDKREDTYRFVAGTYTVNSNMNYDELLLSFVEKHTVTTFRMTIPEGLTVDELVDMFIAQGVGTRESWAEAINNYDFGEDYPFLSGIDMTSGRFYRLEGYLFPDTYEFYSGQEEAYYLRKLLNRFSDMMSEKLLAKCTERGLTVDQAVTIASIIEKEAYYVSDYGKVSAVLRNRLANAAKFPRLECDSTIIYTLSHQSGTRVTELTSADLRLEDPFNSYVNAGLCPGPICNPSLNALYYTLYPDEDTESFFFVTDIDNFVILAKDRAEHQRNVDRVAEEKKALKQ